MKFIWEKEKKEKNIINETITIVENKLKKDQGCSAYNATYSPTCTKRGRHNKEVRLCWDTIQNLRYDGQNFVVDGEIYILLECVSCEDYYLEKSEQNKNVSIDSFKCYDCYEREKK